MAEHLIRFRGGWERHFSSRVGENARRLFLPIRWAPDQPGSIRLSRRFGRPPSDPDRESIRLDFRDVPGLRSAWLNGVELPVGGSGGSVNLDSSLQDRNELVLEIDPTVAATVESAEGWGAIALAIGPRSSPEAGGSGEAG